MANGEGARYRAGQLTETYKALDETVNNLSDTLKKLTQVVSSVDLNSLVKKTTELREASEKATKIQKLTNKTKEQTIALDNKTQIMFEKMLSQQGDLIKIQQKATKAQKELTETRKEDIKAIDPNEWKKRSRIIGDTIKDLEEKGKKFEIFSRETFKAYKKQGGNLADYLAEGILGTREEIKILGVEGAKFRKVLYGFAPPGTFGLLNKLAAPLQIIGGAIREMSSSAQEAEDSYGNLFKTMIKFGKKSVDLFKVDARASRLSKKIDTSGIFKDAKLRRQEIIDAMPKDEKRRFFNSKDEQRKLNRKIFGDASKDADTVKRFRQEREIRAKNLNKLGRNLFRKDKLKVQPEMNIKDFRKLRKEFRNIKFTIINNSVKRFFGKAGKAIKKLLPVVLTGFVKFFLIFSFVMIGIFILVKKFGPVLKSAFEGFMNAFSSIWKGLKIFFAPLLLGIKKIIDSFKKGGTLEELIDGLILFGIGILTSAVGVLLTVLSAALLLLGAVIVESIRALWRGIKESFKSVKGTLNLLLTGISLIVAGVVFFISGAWIAVLVGALVYWLGRKLGKMLGFFADGGTVNTPMQIVGEEGPELVTLPKGAQVTNARKTSQIMGNKSYKTNNTFNITVNAKDTSDAELRRIAQKIGNMVNTNINRSVSSRTMG